MKTKLLLLLVTALLFSTASCSTAGKDDGAAVKETVFNEKKSAPGNKEVFIDDSAFNGSGESVSTTEYGSQEVVRMGKDNSETSTMYDGYGNKTETRTFGQSGSLLCIVVRTSANGQREAIVYGQNGQMKTMPEHLIDSALTAPSSQIAGAVGIYGERVQRTIAAEAKNNQSLRPLPSAQFPVNPPPVPEAAATQNVETSADNAPTNAGGQSPLPKSEIQNNLPRQLPDER